VKTSREQTNFNIFYPGNVSSLQNSKELVRYGDMLYIADYFLAHLIATSLNGW